MRVDTNQIRRQTDLLQIIGGELRRVASTAGGEWAGACPFCGGRDRFRVQPNANGGGRWLCRYCTDGNWRDVIDFVMKSRSLDFRAACAALIGGDLPTVETAVSPLPPSPTLARPPSEDWQMAALTAVGECVETLCTGAGMAAQAWHYLRHNRGLSKETIKAASIGYNPTGRKIAGSYWLEEGIVIPCYVAGALWSVNVRTSKAAQERDRPKYLAMKGSVKGALFGADNLVNAQTAVVCEGEFDTLLLSQFLPEGVAAVTMGSATTGPGLQWRRYFFHCDRVFLVMDDDEAGAIGLAKWQEQLPAARLMPPLPVGGDITDAWAAGADLAEWVGAVKSL